MEGTKSPDIPYAELPEPPAPVVPPPSSSSSTFWLALSLIVMVCSLAWFFYANSHTRSIPPTPIPIVSAPAVSRDVPIYFAALGTVIPTYNVQVRAQVSGILQTVAFKEGQLVKKGDLLAQIDPRPYEALLMQYEGNLKRDSALLANARIDLKRYQQLWSQDSVAQQTLATQKALVEQYEGTVDSDKGLIESTKINLAYCSIQAPIDGRIGLRLVDPGNFIQLSDTTGIAVINTLNPITVVFSIPEDDIPQLLPQVYACQTIDVEAYDRQQSTLLASGVLLTLDNQIDPSTGTVKLKAVFDNKENRLFPNQFVNIKILVRTLTKAIVVPTAAIQHTLKSDFVYVLEQQKVRMNSVHTDTALGDETVISSGLTAGQLVVVEGADKLTNGAHILDERTANSSVSLQTAAHS